jgi:hypothetical protein
MGWKFGGKDEGTLKSLLILLRRRIIKIGANCG